jgi:hypothetical protein
MIVQRTGKRVNIQVDVDGEDMAWLRRGSVGTGKERIKVRLVNFPNLLFPCLSVIPSPSASLRINFVKGSRFPFIRLFAIQKRDPSSLWLHPNKGLFLKSLLRMTLNWSLLSRLK